MTIEENEVISEPGHFTVNRNVDWGGRAFEGITTFIIQLFEFEFDWEEDKDEEERDKFWLMVIMIYQQVKYWSQHSNWL